MTDDEKKHLLLNSIAHARNMRWLNEHVLVDSQEQVVSTSLHAASKILLGQTADINTVSSFEKIVEYISKLPDYERLVAEARQSGVSLPVSGKIPEFKPGQTAWFRMLIDQCSQ